MMMTKEKADTPFSLDDLYELANLEGELLGIAARERLGIDTQPDEDGFTDNIWAVASLAQTFAWECGGDSPRYKHPSCQVLFDDIVALGRSVCPGAWDYFFGVGLKESAARAEGW
ncbi:hypothetical protein [Klebsiella oxytoca]|uniref:hypothetical protein n=1 Tax=Klebsiella oxytoca TaxID=571 RepID=UPI0039C9A969